MDLGGSGRIRTSSLADATSPRPDPQFLSVRFIRDDSDKPIQSYSQIAIAFAAIAQ